MRVGHLYGNEVYALAKELRVIRQGWGENVVYFSNNRERAIQSFNRTTGELYIVASKLKKAIASKPSARKEFEWKGFINVDLTSDQKEAYRAWDIQDSDVWDGIATYAQSGVKVQLSYNKQNDKFNCTGTGQPDAGDNSGYAVSAFGRTPYDAARVWLFKVSSVLPDVWTDYAGADGDDIG